MDIPPVGSLLDFTSRVALVTGAGSDLGRGIALRFAEAGSRLIVHYHTSEAGAREIASRLCERSGEAIALQANLTKESDVARLIQGTVETFGRIDVLINNAGAYPLASLLEMSPEAWDQVVDANLRSVFLCTQAAAKRMKAQGGGAIVNLTSIEAENPERTVPGWQIQVLR